MRTIEQMISSEVLCCMSSIINTLATAYGAGIEGDRIDSLTDQAFELACPIDDWEEAAIQSGAIRYAAGQEVIPPSTDSEWWYIAGEPDGDWWTTAEMCCRDRDIEPYQSEVFEHWAVTDWFADKLEAAGEKVDKDFGELCIWARTTTGQNIAADYVIEKIVADLAKAHPDA